MGNPNPVSRKGTKSKLTASTPRVVPNRNVHARDGAKNLEARTIYLPAHAEKAFGLCLLGMTDEQLGKTFDVTPATIVRWTKEHPAFAEALYNGREGADEEIARSMRQMAKGYDYHTEEVKVIGTGIGTSQTEIVKVKKFQPADQKAGAYWLSKRQRALWGDTPAQAAPQDAARAAREAIAAMDQVLPEDEDGQ